MYEQGRYWGRVVRAELGETSNGNPQVVIRFTVLGKVNAEDPSGALIPCDSHDRTIYRVITEKSVDWVVRDMRALGYQRDGFAFLHAEHPHYDSLEGKEFEAECKHDNYQGQTREKWFVFDPEGGPQVKPLDKAAARKLDAMFGKSFKQHAAAEKPAPEAKKASVAHPEASSAGSDIPF